MHEKRVQLLRNLLLVRKVKRSLEGDPATGQQLLDVKPAGRFLPDALEMHWSNLNDVPGLLALQDAVATASSHTGDVQKLGAIDHVIVWRNKLATSYSSIHVSLLPSLLATQTPLASTWKHKLPSSSHNVAVTLGFIPGGAI